MSVSYGDDDPTEKAAISSEPLCRCFSLAEIQSATDNFDDKLVVGVGGFGKVYKGFVDGTAVAVKRLNPESKQGEEEFWTEVRMLSELRHPHLVALIGYCNDSDEMILVYEFIARGTLADHLHKIGGKGEGKGDGSSLSWERRLSICVGAARGLDYLHRGSTRSFIHRDVKTTNILVDEKWVGKIADFGLSKGTASQSKTHVSTAVKGTFGYLDPDYFMTQRLTKKSDVYAFGVVMLEVLCGRPAVDIRLEEEQISLVYWAQDCIRKGKLYQIIDPSLRGKISPDSLKCFVEVAGDCLRDRPQGRPTMAEVAAAVELALAWQRERKTEDDRSLPHPPAAEKKGRHHRPSLKKWIGNSIDAAVESFRNALPESMEFRIGLPEAGSSGYYGDVGANDGKFTARGNQRRAPDYRNIYTSENNLL